MPLDVKQLSNGSVRTDEPSYGRVCCRDVLSDGCIGRRRVYRILSQH